MALERKDLVQDNSTTAGTGAFTMAGTPPAGFFPFSVHTTGATFDYKAVAGSQVEVGSGTWNGTSIARSPSSNFNGGALVNFSTPPVVMEVVNAASVATFLRASDGVDVSTLTAVTSLIAGDSVLILRSGGMYTAAYTLFGSTNTTTPTQVITVNNPGPQTVGTTYTASGTYANGTPTALDFSVDGGTNWTAVPSPTIGGGNFSFSSTPSTPSASRQMMVRDHTTLVSGISPAYVVSAASTQTISVANPGAQTVGTQFNVTGTWSVTQPSALDYRLSDDTAGVWTAAPAGVVINANGTYSFPLTPSTTSASRTISVRDRTTLVSGTSGSYAVSAAAGGTMASLYQIMTGFNTASITGPQATGGASPDLNWGFSPVRLNIKSAGGAVPLAADVKFVFGKKGLPPPTTFANGGLPAGSTNGNATAHSNGVQTVSRLGGWTDNTSQYFGTLSADGTLYAWGTQGTFVLYVIYRDESFKAYDNNTGTPVEWVLS